MKKINKRLDIVSTNLRIFLGKNNISYKILMNKSNIRISYSQKSN